MIIDLQRFLAEERPHWNRLEQILDRLEADPAARLGLDAVGQFHYLYQRASADLARIATVASEPDLHRYLESLVARAYAESHETRQRPHRLAPGHWLRQTFPQTFRNHLRAFGLAVAMTLAGVLFGGLAVGFDPEAKPALMPFPQLLVNPAERVAREENATEDRFHGAKATFSTFLMTHNTRVALLTLALGMTWGVGTLVLLFYNGVILGAVGVDYLAAGQTKFLLGWLLPHGVIEIPAILIAGQAGLILASALIGWGGRLPLKQRLRQVLPDLVTLAAGAGLLLVWAGIIESFLSQYHEPILPYIVKIGFGCAELVLLVWFLARSGSGPHLPSPEPARLAREEPRAAGHRLVGGSLPSLPAPGRYSEPATEVTAFPDRPVGIPVVQPPQQPPADPSTQGSNPAGAAPGQRLK